MPDGSGKVCCMRSAWDATGGMVSIHVYRNVFILYVIVNLCGVLLLREAKKTLHNGRGSKVAKNNERYFILFRAWNAWNRITIQSMWLM